MRETNLYSNQPPQDMFCTGLTTTVLMFTIVAVLDDLMSATRRRTHHSGEEDRRIFRNRPCSVAVKMSKDRRVKLVAAVFAIAVAPHLAAGQTADPSRVTLLPGELVTLTLDLEAGS